MQIRARTHRLCETIKEYSQRLTLGSNDSLQNGSGVCAGYICVYLYTCSQHVCIHVIEVEQHATDRARRR